MSDDEKQTAPKVADETAVLLEALYGDPLSTETLRIGRYLVIASAILMAVVLFKVRLQGTSFVPIDFGDRVDVLPMLLSLGVLLLLLHFVLRSTTDILRDRETALLVTRYIEGQRVEAAVKAAREVDENMSNNEGEYYGDSDGDPWWEPVAKVREAAEKAVAKAEARIGVRHLPRDVRRARKLLEVGIPIFFAFIALTLSRGSLAAFSSALLAAFTPGP